MKKRTKKILIGSGVAVAGVAALTALHRKTAKRLMNVALDREEPRSITINKEKLTETEGMSETLNQVMTAAGELENRGLERVELIGHDGTLLVGHWYCPESPKRVIVAMHGWRSSWSQDFGVIAPFWFENDCAVLFAEQRGQGESGGEYMGFGLLERYDCLDWIYWVNEKTEKRFPVYLGGVSMGATTVLMTGGFDLPENVRGIVADCGFTTPHAIWKHVVESNLHLPYGLYSAAARDLCKRKLRVTADSYSSVDALRECKVPVLFIHGTADHFVPVEMTYENYIACASSKKLLVVPGAEHGMSYLTDREGYQAAIKDFWREYDC